MTPVRAVRGGSGVSTRTARHRDGARARDGDAHAHRAAASARTDSARPRTDSAARQARTHHTTPTAHDNPPAAQPRCVLRPVLAARLAQAQRLCRAACAAATPCARASALPLRSGPGLCRADCSSGRRASPHRTAFTVRARPRRTVPTVQTTSTSALHCTLLRSKFLRAFLCARPAPGVSSPPPPRVAPLYCSV